MMKTLALFSLTASSLAHAASSNCSMHPLVPSLLPTCEDVFQRLEKVADLSKTDPARASQSIAEARQRFWKVFPNGPDLAARELEFLYALAGKDLLYLTFALPEGMTGAPAKLPNALPGIAGGSPPDSGGFPTIIDNGLRPYAKPLFTNWVNALRRAEGARKDGDVAVFAIPAATQDRSNWRKAYEDARNWSELLSSGTDLARFVPAKVYLVRQMEADVALLSARSNPAYLPDPLESSRALYDQFVKMFGESAVLDAAAATLKAPKNSVGGLTPRAEAEVGTYFGSSPNPYMLFLTRVTHSSERAYAISLALDQYGLMGGQAADTLIDKSKWEHALAVYDQMAAKYGTANVLAAAGRLLTLPKDASSGIKGDRSNKGLLYWFDTLIRNPKAEIPDGRVPQFRAGSYDPRWIGQTVDVRGTVSRVEIETGRFPPYGTIHFKESSDDKFTVFTPNSDILEEQFGAGGRQLVGRVLQVAGQVERWRAGAGIRFLTHDQLKILDVSALSPGFHDSTPPWMSSAPKMESGPDSEKFLAWSRFPVGSKVTYESRLYTEVRPGSQKYTRRRVSQSIYELRSIDAQVAAVAVATTNWDPRGGVTHSSNDLYYRAKESAALAQLAGVAADRIQKTTGEETLVINGKSIPTRWERLASTDAPQNYVKTWTSDQVPGAIVLQRSELNRGSRVAGRSISELIYAPIEGAEPEVTGGTAQSELGAISPSSGGPSQQGRPAGIPAAPAPQAKGRGGALPGEPSTIAQAEWMQRYRDDSIRMARLRSAILPSRMEAKMPLDVREAYGRLDLESRLVGNDLRTRNWTRVPQSLQAFESSLATVEKFLAK